ncbi:MAG: TolC family protein [Flavobacterium sp.]
MFKIRIFTILALFSTATIFAQKYDLTYFLNQAEKNSATIKENQNLLKIGDLQSEIIKAQNSGFLVNATSDVLFAPFFDSNGKAIEVTTTPSSNAYGYDAGITNGGLYSAQINITKNLFNRTSVANLLLQNRVLNNSISLNSEDFRHNLIKNITDSYIAIYQLQLQRQFQIATISDFKNRLKVVELLVKKGILQQSDYLLLQLDIDTKQIELQQTSTNLEISKSQLQTMSGVAKVEINQIEIPSVSVLNFIDKPFIQKKFENDSLQIMANQKVFENQYKPQISLYGNAGLNAVEITDMYRKIGASAGVRLSIPIYDGHQRKVNAEQNLLRTENLSSYKEISDLQRENNITQINTQISENEKALALLQNQQKKYEQILEIYKGKLVQGQISIVEYLNLMQTYRMSVYINLQAQTNHWLLQSQLNYLQW